MSTSVSENNKRIAKNTIYLYVRMFITMAIGIYASRIVLKVLGASDYGLYNVVGGVVSMFAMISAALQVGTQRFLNFAMGENDPVKLKKTFSISLGLYVMIGIFIFIIGETIGLWFILNYLNVPDGRMTAVIWVYQFSLVSFIANLIQIPFQSCIIAHENMSIYAFMSIYDAIMKLLMIVLIQFLDDDKLILYATLIFAVQLSSIIIYNVYCRHKYEECTFKILYEKKLAKEIVSYSGWNLLGGGAVVLTNGGLNILLNIFCGSVINAARGIAITVNTYIVSFINNFQTAANPQIVKLYASKELDRFYKLLINNSRISVYLYLLVAIPAWIEIGGVLKIWLGEYPAYTEDFVRIILIQSLFSTLNQPIQMSIHASGQMKWINIVNSLVLSMSFPLSFIALKFGYSPISVFIINGICFVGSNVVCLFFSHKYTGLSIGSIIKEVYLNVAIGSIIMFSVPYVLHSHLTRQWQSFWVVCIVSVITSCLVVYFWGMTKGMRIMLMEKIKSKL